LPNLTAGVRRALARVHPDTTRESDPSTPPHPQRYAFARLGRPGPDRAGEVLPVEHETAAGTSASVPPTRTPRRARRYGAHPIGRLDRATLSTRARTLLAGPTLVGAARTRALPLTVAGLVLAASVLSVAPTVGRPASDSAVAGGGSSRLVVGGGVLGPAEAAGPSTPSATPEVALRALGAQGSQDLSFPNGPYLADGTLLKPVAVETTIPDARSRLTEYRVKSGDTLTGIASRFGVSMMTIWWANQLTAKDELHIGQRLVIPPVDGLVVTVGPDDTLEGIASQTGISASTISKYNGLVDGFIAVNQVLIIPGARGDGIPEAAPAPAPAKAKAVVKKTTAPAKPRTTSRTVVKSPGTYSGGTFAFPIPGHRITQYFHAGHPGIDIQGSTGDRVRAAGAGVVIHAGWYALGGGNAVWISHGSGLYTTYSHLSKVLVRVGQRVSRLQVVGLVGATGWATGPHLHFEVWKGGVPGGVDHRVNPMRYL
jgi:murein DD-endopeptidase MepM/ murein hydrolase activator NlpD